MIRYFLVISALVPGLLGQESPCYDNWYYSKLNGKCYKNVASPLSKQDAVDSCSNSLTNENAAYTPGTIYLSRIQTMNDVISLRTYLVSVSNNAPLWMDTNPPGNPGTFRDGKALNVELLTQLYPSFVTPRQCLTFSYSFVLINGQYSYKYNISEINCTNSNVFVCEHDSVRCNEIELQYNGGTMQLIPPPPEALFIFSYIYISCQRGFYRKSEMISTTAAQTQPIPPNYAYCTGTRDPSKNPFTYNSKWNMSATPEDCIPVSCAQFSGTLNNVVSQIPTQLTTAKTFFMFGESFNVTCLRGYVSYTDPTKMISALSCQQSLVDKSQGEWAPTSNNPCVPIKCNLTALYGMIPQNAVIQSARNKVTQQQYDVTFQTSFLPLFNNIISIQCLDGFFYEDRTWSKQVICDLNNNSLTSGNWQGYLGTILPLSSSCQSATCKYEAIIINPSYNLQPFFQMMNTLGVFVNQTQPSGNPYPFQTQLLFNCLSGYTTASGSTSQNLVCGAQGNWIPNLTPCISIIPPLNIGKGQHYVPPAKEAVSAQQIGVVAIIIMVLFLSLIVILDLSTLARDVKTMRTNIQRLKERFNKNKNN